MSTPYVFVRNPKQDPKKGDVYKRGRHTVWVDRKDGCVIHYRISADRTNSPHYMNIERFRAFIANAEVIEEGK